jgi:hypothetical protein
LRASSEDISHARIAGPAILEETVSPVITRTLTRPLKTLSTPRLSITVEKVFANASSGTLGVNVRWNSDMSWVSVRLRLDWTKLRFSKILGICRQTSEIASTCAVVMAETCSASGSGPCWGKARS